MTFTEAAAQVLRLVGKPLHYKEITDVAIERDLLSHVGKSPEVTMAARLAALVKKGDKENPLVRVKPGVFALREWDQGTIERGLTDRTPALKMIVENDPEAGSNPEGSAAPERSRPDGSFDGEEDDAPILVDDAERARAELAATASELFAAEEDDDEPILGGADDDEAGDEVRPRGDDVAGARQQQGRRRRRRGRGRGPSGPVSGGGGGDDLPTYTVSDAVVEPQPMLGEDDDEGDAEDVVEARERAPRGEPREPREAREPREPREAREPRDGERRDFRDRDRDRGEPRFRDGRDGEARDGGAPIDDLDGVPLADAAVELLAQFERQGPTALRQLVDAARRRGRLTGDPQQAIAALSAALRADNARRAADSQRPRFRFSSGRVGLTDWLLDPDLRRLERDVLAAAERYREAARRALARKIQGLPPRAMGEIAMIVLERLGIADLQPIRRPGATGAELVLSGKAPGPVSPMQTAIVVRRDGRDIGREQVTELRGSLHHFGPASAGLIVTAGQVLSGAREEAASPGASPVRLLDGAALARLCEEHGVGVLRTPLDLPLPDAELFEALRSNNGG